MTSPAPSTTVPPSASAQRATVAPDAAAAHPAPSALFLAAMEALAPLVEKAFPERITDDEQGVILAMSAALKADCTRRRVGAVIADRHGRFVITGRNGAPPGHPGCLSAGACPRGRMTYDQVAPLSAYADGDGRCIANHAETNAVMFVAPELRRGGTIYISCGPCSDCARMLAGSGLARVVWPVAVEGEPGQWRIASRRLGPDTVIDSTSTFSSLAAEEHGLAHHGRLP